MAKDEKREQRIREAVIPPPGTYALKPGWQKDVRADGWLVFDVPEKPPKK